ncbi:MAG: M48 family metallopeptidase [Pseudomonadota bacterium]
MRTAFTGLKATMMLAALACVASVVVEAQTPGSDARIVEQQLKAVGGLYTDARAQDELKRLLEHLSPQSLLPIQLLRHPSANAFVLPTDKIYLHTGLLLRVANETELAALVAHELAHVSLGHLDNLDPSADLLDRRSVEAEVAADARAIEIMRRAGYCPRSASTFFERLIRERQATNAPTRFVRTHPNLEARVSHWRQADCAEGHSRQPLATSLDWAMSARLDALSMLLLQQRMDTVAFLSTQTFLLDDLGASGAYFWGESLRVRDAPGDGRGASEFLLLASTSDTHADIAMFRLAAIAVDEGQWRAARDWLLRVDQAALPDIVATYFMPVLTQVEATLAKPGFD